VNNGPLLFFGILATLASSFWGLLLAPQLQIGRQQPAVLESTGLKAAAEATAGHGTAEVSATHALAPMATGRNCVGRDDGTSQRYSNDDDGDSMQRGFPHSGYLRSK